MDISIGFHALDMPQKIDSTGNRGRARRTGSDENDARLPPTGGRNCENFFNKKRRETTPSESSAKKYEEN